MDDPSACKQANGSDAHGSRRRSEPAVEGSAAQLQPEQIGFRHYQGTPSGGLASRATFKNFRCISRAAPAWLNIGKIGEGQAMLDTLVIGLLRSEDRYGEFSKAAVDLGLEGIVSKRAKSLYRRWAFEELAQDQQHDRGRSHHSRHRGRRQRHPMGTAGSGAEWRAGDCRPGDIAAAITCPGGVGREVRGYVDRQAGIEGLG